MIAEVIEQCGHEGRSPGHWKAYVPRRADVRNIKDLLFVVLRDRPLHFLSILAVELIAQALLVLELFVLLRVTGKPFSVLHPFLIEAATKFVGLAFFFIPGQVGAVEGTYALNSHRIHIGIAFH